MRKIQSLFLALFLLMSANSLMAQDCTGECQTLGYRPYPYGFVQMQGGVGTTLTDVPFTKLLSPTASIGVGFWPSSAVGARVHFNMWESKGGFDVSGPLLTYKYNYLNSNFDLMFNLTNFASKKSNHFFNIILLGGFGLNYAWNNDELRNLVVNGNDEIVSKTVNSWGQGTTREHLLSGNIRAGLLCDLNLSKHWNIGLEVDANCLSDRFNSKYTNTDDWMITAQIGVTYKFGHKKPHVIKVAEPERTSFDYDANRQTATAQNAAVKPVVAEETKIEVPKLEETIYYELNMDHPNPTEIIQKVVTWSKNNPDKKIEISGYADKETGNPNINAKLAEQRAQSVASELKENGVSENQIIIKSYGDTVQPYTVNEKNRCTIILGK